MMEPISATREGLNIWRALENGILEPAWGSVKSTLKEYMCVKWKC